MKRYQKLGAAGATFLAVWAAALQSGLVSRHPALLWAPVLGVLALGAYMAALLAWGVMTFRSRPQEAAALHKDIARARDSLMSKGYVFPGMD